MGGSEVSGDGTWGPASEASLPSAQEKPGPGCPVKLTHVKAGCLEMRNEEQRLLIKDGRFFFSYRWKLTIPASLL